MTDPNRDPENWVETGQLVEARLADGDIHVVGKVIAYLDAPSVIIETDDGERLPWLLRLTHPIGEVCGELTDSLRVSVRCIKPANHYGERHTANLGVGTFTWGYLPHPDSDA